MPTFSATHPWLRFTIDLKAAPATLWMLLGEAQSKCNHIAGVPLRPSVAAELHKIYLVKGVNATTAIEGNTLTEEEVRQRIDGRLELPPSKAYLQQEIDNVIEACRLIGERTIEGRAWQLSLADFLAFNELVLRKLPLEDGVVPGKIRRHNVTVARYRGAPADECEVLLGKLCVWLNGEEFSPNAGSPIVLGLVRAVLAHLYLAWVHPFGDGNGRTARLVEYQILLAAGVPIPAAHLLSNHYNQTRQEYYRQLDRASQSGGDVIPFLHYAVQGFVDGLRGQLDHIRRQQWEVAWENYVHDFFRDRTSANDKRKRDLVLALTRHREAVAVSKIPTIDHRLALAYHEKSDRTLMRDLDELVAAELIERTNAGYRARPETILAFLPARCADGVESQQPDFFQK